MDDEDLTKPIKGWGNPFLRNLPMVAIVRQRVVRNGEILRGDETQSKRVFFRVPNNRVVPAFTDEGEIMPRQSQTDRLYGFNNLVPFDLP